MTEVEYGIVTGSAPSLQTVGNDIAYALNKLGHSAICTRYQVPYYRAKKLFNRAIVFIPFDPLCSTAWFVMAKDYLKAGIPTVFYTTVEGIPKEKYIKDWYASDLLYIANSEYTKEMMEKVNIPVSEIIYHGINLDHIAQSKPQKDLLKAKLNAKVVFGTVCSDLPRKGLKTLAQVTKLVEEELPDAKFYILTKIMGRSYFTSTKNVVIDPRFGKLERQKVLSLIGSFDFYICSSHAEGFGLPLLEAQAQGVPVICGEYKPLTEITTKETSLYVPIYDVRYQDDRYGILFSYHLYNPEDMASKIKEAYEIYTCNQEKYHQMSQKAKEQAKKFNILDVYKEFIR